MMSSPANITTNLVDKLNQKALLSLAAEEGVSSRPGGHVLPTTAELNTLFDDLEILELVGTGGMGCVYRARQSRLEREVALKVLPRELGSDDMFAERFAREARAMAKLNHPNVVSIHDFGEIQGLHYLVMEHMDGMNLRELLEAGPLAAGDALRIFEQVCQALAFSHAEGVVHRDIKPENILFSKQGHVALADFGLARLATDSNVAVSLTQTRQAMGTLNYMAPEQWENPKSVDHRADIYSLGILLYEMLTGRVPRGSFPPASTLASVSTSIDEAINKSLRIDAADRHASVLEFCQAVICEEPGTSRQLAFDQNGTFTNFMNVGANMLRILPVPQTQSMDRIQKNAVVISVVAAICSTAICNGDWIRFNRIGIEGLDSYVLIERVQIPVEVIPYASWLLVVLAVLRKKIHPLRSDLISLTICGLVIAQLVFSLNSLMPNNDFSILAEQANGKLTVLPFLMLGVFGFQFIETLIRIGYLAWLPFRNVYEKIKAHWDTQQAQQQAEKDKRKEKWQQRWQYFSKRCLEMLGMDSGKGDS